MTDLIFAKRRWFVIDFGIDFDGWWWFNKELMYKRVLHTALSGNAQTDGNVRYYILIDKDDPSK